MGLKALAQELGDQPQKEQEGPSIGQRNRAKNQGASSAQAMESELLCISDLLDRVSLMETNFNDQFSHVNNRLNHL